MRFRLLLLCGLIPLLCGIANGQTTFATITGTVTDGTGAVIPNAQILATNVQTGITYPGVSNNAGAYTLPQLKEGPYKVKVSAAGFTDFHVDDIVLASRDIRRVDVVLQVGATSTSIEVTAGATVIETETARLSTFEDAKALGTLPLNARWLHAFFILIPNYNTGGNDGMRFGGSLGNQTGWTIDGTSYHDGVSGFAGPQTNYVESVQEVNFAVGTNSAAYNGVAQVSVVSKSGTNQLHGAAATYYNTPWFRARSPFATARTPGVYHIYAGSLGGPVYLPKVYNGRNRSFFFISREGSVGGDTVTSLNPTVPTAAWRAGNFSSLAATIYDPDSGLPFPGNVIPANRINDFSKKYQDKFYPLPNYGDVNVFASNNYRELKTKPWDRPIYTAMRIDHHFSDRNLVYGRYTFTDGPSTGWESNLPTVGIRSQRRPTRTATISYMRTLSPSMTNEVRFGLFYQNIPYRGPQSGDQFISEFGIKGVSPGAPTAYGITGVNFSGVGIQGVSASTWGDPSYKQNNQQIQDQFSWFRGRHSIMIGADIGRVRYDEYVTGGNILGGLTFSNRFTSNGLSGQGHPYADFLLGLPTTLSRDPAPLSLARRRNFADFFIQDDFKVNSRLTLGIGLRYELHPTWTDEGGYLSAFDIKSGSIIVPDAAIGKVTPIFPSKFATVIAAGAAGYNPKSLINTDKNNFGPHLSIAYRPFGNNTVIRSGFSLGYDSVPSLPTSGGSPFVLTEMPYNNDVKKPIVAPNIFPAAGTNGPGDVSLPAAYRPDLRVPYVMQYSFTVEHQLARNLGARVSYLGTFMRQGVFSYDYNQPVPDNRPYISKPRPFMPYSSVMYNTNGAGHSYNALTGEIIRRMNRGIYFQSNYTWARDIGDLVTPENAFDRKRERGVMQGVPTQRFTNALIYELPFGKGKKWASNVSRTANLLAGGWTLAVTYIAQTGQFLTPLWSGPDTAGTAYTQSATPANVSRRPDVTSNPNLAGDARKVSAWFSKDAFRAPVAGQYGSAARGIVIGPGVNAWNMSLNKDFIFGERLPRLRWEMSAINAFNHPNWSNPSMTVSNAGTAAVISAVGGVGDNTGARTLRMTVRAEF